MSDIYTVRGAAAERKARGGVGVGIRLGQVTETFTKTLDRLLLAGVKHPQFPVPRVLWKVTGERDSGLATVATAYLPTICFPAD